MHFAIGTTNIPKRNAIEQVLCQSPFTQGATFSNHRVSSGVPDMPITLEEIRTWAKNRAILCRRERPDADFFVGMEWGIYKDSEWDEYWLTCVVYIENQDGKWFFWYSCHLPLPDRVTDSLFDGRKRDLEEVVQELYGEESIGDKEWSFWLFSLGLLPRSGAFAEATIAALVPHFSTYFR